MGMAYITKHGEKAFTVQESDGKVHEYEQGDGVETPTEIHADILWIPQAAKKYEVKFPGDILPEVLVIRDGGWPGYHQYNRRSTT